FENKEKEFRDAREAKGKTKVGDTSQGGRDIKRFKSNEPKGDYRYQSDQKKISADFKPKGDYHGPKRDGQGNQWKKNDQPNRAMDQKAIVPFAGSCWECKQPGHRSFECPQRKGKFDKRAAPPTHARTFAVIAGGEQMQGIISVSRSEIRVLFDCGASHSFISRQYVEKEHLKTTPLPGPFCVSTPTGGSTILYDQCENFKFKFVGRVFVMDLVVLGFEGFQLILGMNWLSKHRVVLDCGLRTVTIRTPGLPRVAHTCVTPEDSIMTSFLYTVEIPKQDISQVEVVCEYEDVFAEIPGLPPKRKVEFRIDLVPGASPISKAAYRMASKELE
ncbi:Retrotransposon protein, putative, Ty3-gypsy subclass, partial [Thalictrum thalictroides]